MDGSENNSGPIKKVCNQIMGQRPARINPLLSKSYRARLIAADPDGQKLTSLNLF
jgi:hypothetical protein